MRKRRRRRRENNENEEVEEGKQYSEGRLTLSKPSTNYLKRSFSYSGAMLWNNLPKNLINAAYVEIPTRQSCKAVVISFSF